MNELHNAPPREQRTKNRMLFTVAALLLGILVCMLCLASLTWAWFTGTISGDVDDVNSATYTVISLVTAEDGTVLTQTADGSFQLLANTRYDVELIAGGSAQRSGYCVVRLPAETLHTQQFSSGESFRFRLVLPQEGAVSFCPEWGTYSGIAEIAPNAQLGTLTEPPDNEEPDNEEPDNEETTEPLTEDPTEPSTQTPTDPTEPPTEPPTQAETEPPTQAETEPPPEP